jgi:mono/diheme cytochrome c family protein
MKRILSLAVIAATVALVVYGVLTLYDETMQVGRMWETPVVKPHEEPIAIMASGIVPFSGGEEQFRQADPLSLQAPFNLNEPQVIAAGQQGYVFYCIQCHGKHHDGNGTVGQSFAPLPGNLRSAKVQNLPVGKLFHEISYGIPGGRQPALASTISFDERWQIIAYIKSLGIEP